MIYGKERSAFARYSAGRRALAAHDPARALPHFRAAVDAVAPSERRELARNLYWLAITLNRLGKAELAIKALASAQKLEPRGRARALYCRISNEYGMARSSCREHDDYKAFFSIQLRRYLNSVPGAKFESGEEMEAVLAIIADAWIRLGRTRDLSLLNCADKLAVYQSAKIVFPEFGRFAGTARVLPGDFGSTAGVPRSGRCSCGSGLPSTRCCGRVSAPSERRNG